MRNPINDEQIDTAAGLDITMPMYNLIEYSDNYSDTYGSLQQFKKDESTVTKYGNFDNFTKNNSTIFT